MKAVLISIQPKWAELIANGKKTVEVRKSRPKLETPFKCYIYCTSPKKFIHGYADDDLFRHKDGRIECGFSYQLACEEEEGEDLTCNILSRKVIGEFVCDHIKTYEAPVIYSAMWEVNGAYVPEELRYQNGTRLSYEEMADYSKGKDLYGWHISELKIYDRPKWLWEFSASCGVHCKNCTIPIGLPKACLGNERRRLIRPPQSWCYVEV